MGNLSQNLSEKHFSIVLEKSTYYPGQLLKGLLKLQTKSYIQTCKITYTIRQTESFVQKTISEKQSKSSTHRILSLTLSYPNLEKIDLSSGILIPFTFQLPNNMLPTLEYTLNNQSAFIRTELYVALPFLNLSDIIFFNVRNYPIPLSSPLKISTFLKKNFLLINKGQNFLEGCYPKNNFSFYQTIPLTIGLDYTSSNTKCKKIICSLCRRVSLNDPNQKEKKEFIDILSTQEIVPFNEKSVFNVPIKIIEPENIANSHKIKNNEINDNRQFINYLPSVNSSLITCDYYITIDAIFGLIESNMKILMPLNIAHENEEISSMIGEDEYRKVSSFIDQINLLNNSNPGNKDKFKLAPNMNMVKLDMGGDNMVMVSVGEGSIPSQDAYDGYVKSIGNSKGNLMANQFCNYSNYYNSMTGGVISGYNNANNMGPGPYNYGAANINLNNNCNFNMISGIPNMGNAPNIPNIGCNVNVNNNIGANMNYNNNITNNVQNINFYPGNEYI